MMDHEDQLKLQSYLDDELPESEAREVAGWIKQDPQRAALLSELRQTHEVLAGFEDNLRLPETREFYWSKIRREIQRQDVLAPRVVPLPWLYRLRRFLVPATGLAVIALLALIASREAGTGAVDTNAETALEDAGAFTYHDYSAGATLVWLSYPADNEIADDEDLNSLD